MIVHLAALPSFSASLRFATIRHFLNSLLRSGIWTGVSKAPGDWAPNHGQGTSLLFRGGEWYHEKRGSWKILGRISKSWKRF